MRTRGLVDGADTDVAIPMMIDHYLDHGAGLTYAVFPGDSDGSPVVRVTYQEYARAVHRFAQTQREAPRDEVVAIIATCDTLVSATAVFGIMRAGLVVSWLPLIQLLNLTFL